MAYWCYMDGVDTVIRMAVDYGLSLGFSSAHLLSALLLTQLVGFPAALVFGGLGERFGAKRAVGGGILVYLVFTAWGARMETVGEFFTLAAGVGLVQGGVQALSRSLFVRLVPPGRSGEFFGFYNLVGKFAAVLGPVLVGVMGSLTGSPRAGILAVAVLFGAGWILLSRVKVEEGRKEALRYEKDFDS